MIELIYVVEKHNTLITIHFLLASCAAEHHVNKVGMGDTGDTASTGGGITQGVSNFLQGGGVYNSIVWVRDVGPFGVNGKEGRGYTQRISCN